MELPRRASGGSCWQLQLLDAVHALQESGDGEAVCAPRAGYQKLRLHPHWGYLVLEQPSVLQGLPSELT